MLVLLVRVDVLIGIRGGNLLREKLAKLRNMRKRFKGTFDRFGLKSGYKGPLTTVLLKDIIDVSSGKVVTDHLWFNLTKGLEKLQLLEGDIVGFDARVTRYLKGYQGIREDELHPVGIDYRLSFPTKVEKLYSILHSTTMCNIVVHDDMHDDVQHTVMRRNASVPLMAINKCFKDEGKNKQTWFQNKTLDSFFSDADMNSSK